MQRLILGLTVFFAVLVLVRPARADDGLARVKATKTLRWGADLQGGEPYAYQNDEGKIVGFEVDLAWSAGKLTRATVRSPHGGTAKLRYRDTSTSLNLPPGADVVYGGPYDDMIKTFGGDDVVYGGAGDDEIFPDQGSLTDTPDRDQVHAGYLRGREIAAHLNILQAAIDRQLAPEAANLTGDPVTSEPDPGPTAA